LECLGTEPVDQVPDLEFGAPQELMIRLGGEQLSDPAKVGLGSLQKSLIDPLSLFLLLGIELVSSGHGYPL
jgi:hypothetical protein